MIPDFVAVALFVIAATVPIPVKMNAIPVGSRTAFRWEGEHPSERSDAGSTIVQKVFDFVKCGDGEKG